jgi:hypothetical protein
MRDTIIRQLVLRYIAKSRAKKRHHAMKNKQ